MECRYFEYIIYRRDGNVLKPYLVNSIRGFHEIRPINWDHYRGHTAWIARDIAAREAKYSRVMTEDQYNAKRKAA